MKKILVLLLTVLLSTLLFAQNAQNLFIDVAESKGINYQGKSFGSSWADIDGDGRLDLYISCHSNRADTFFLNDIPTIYFNAGDTFIPLLLVDENDPNNSIGSDWHGTAFFDFDRDGDLDQLNMLGGSSDNVFFVNDGTLNFPDQAAAFNLTNSNASGRTPGLLDINKDGFTDVILNGTVKAADPFFPKLMINNNGETFEEAPESANFDWIASLFSTSADFEGDGGLDIISLSGRPTIYQVENESLGAPQNVGQNKVTDFIVEDLNGDLKPDIFSVQANSGLYVEDISSALIRSSLSLSSSVAPASFEFSSSSDVIDFTVFPRTLSSTYILVIGEEVQDEITGSITSLSLSASDPNVIGDPEIDLFSPQPRIYINYDPITDKWTVTAKSGTSSTATLGLDTEGSDLVLESSFPVGPNLGADLYYNQGNYQFEEQNLPQFDETDNFLSVVAADFDNDMDLDLYAVRTSYADNKENVLWENDNNTDWIRHDGAWGAVGDGDGIGEGVSLVDFNNDGFMDLYVTNGAATFWVTEANTNLYENQTNSNNWVKVELEGINSDPIGLHSRVLLHAGGKTQLRYQNGATHKFSQNDTRLHFGLAQNTSIDSLEVFWPSGIRQVVTDLEINQIATITEEAPCEDPYPMVDNLRTRSRSDGVLLEWDPVPGSRGCRVRAGLTNSPSPLQSFLIFEENASEFFISQDQLQNGQNYQWRVRCGCTFGIIGESSPFDFFTWNTGSSTALGKSELNFFPNPVYSELNVTLNMEEEGDYEVTIYDLQGRSVKERFVHVRGSQNMRFDLSDLESGVYIFQISNGRLTISEKIVKQ